MGASFSHHPTSQVALGHAWCLPQQQKSNQGTKHPHFRVPVLHQHLLPQILAGLSGLCPVDSMWPRVARDRATNMAQHKTENLKCEVPSPPTVLVNCEVLQCELLCFCSVKRLNTPAWFWTLTSSCGVWITNAYTLKKACQGLQPSSKGFCDT